MAATIRDIKEQTGLSLATISKYLNGGNVLPENKEKIEAYTAEIEQLKKSLSSKEDTINKKKEQILESAREDARQILEEAKSTADAAIRDINKWKQNPAAADTKAMEQHRTALREKRDSLNKKNDNKRRSSNHKPEDFTPGDSVYVISFDSEGTVLSKADSKGRINVQIGMSPVEAGTAGYL